MNIIFHTHLFHLRYTKLLHLILWIRTLFVLLKNYHKDVYLTKHQIVWLAYNPFLLDDMPNVHKVKIRKHIQLFQHTYFSEQMAFPLLYRNLSCSQSTLSQFWRYCYTLVKFLWYHNISNWLQNCMHLF